MKYLRTLNKLPQLLLAMLGLMAISGCDEKPAHSAYSTPDISSPNTSTSIANETTVPHTTAPVSTPALADAIRLYDHMEKTDNRVHIYGLVENLNRSAVSMLILQFNLYDQYGTQVGEASATITNLEAGGRATLSAYSSGRATQVTSYKLVKTTAF